MKEIVLALGMLAATSPLYAQEDGIKEMESQIEELRKSVEDSKKLKVSGYIQTQAQWGQEDASLRVGAGQYKDEGAFNRIGIRRGRIKFAYGSGGLSSVFQLDITEKGVNFKDAYLALGLSSLGQSSIQAGIFDRPFGYEIGYSSSRRESPERSLLFNTLFPDERDLGAMVTLRAAKTSQLSFLTLQAGLFAGNGIKRETDSHKDFIGRLSAEGLLSDNIKGAIGVSYYNGGVYQGTANVYKMQGKEFILDSSSDNIGRFAKREYFGLEGRLAVISDLGMTHLRAEYLWGQQPGVKGNSKSPNASSLTVADTYIRPFSGWYVMLVQDLGSLPLSAVLKVDTYDPNTQVAGSDLGQGSTGAGDINYTTYGVGLLWNISSALRLQGYYELVQNEKSQNLSGYTSDLKDNVFTLRLQYKF